MPPTRVPTAADFASLPAPLTTSLHFPTPPESTTAILLLFHGLGDNERPFRSFAQSINLPGVLAVSVRGTSPLPPYLLPDGDGDPARPTEHFHWGDDLTLDPATGQLDPDPGFAGASRLVMDRIVRDVLVDRCGWRVDDVLLFGFGQGGSLALGLASLARMPAEVVDVTNEEEEEEEEASTRFKGVVSVGGPLPASMVPTVGARARSRTPVLVCCGREGEAVDEEAEEVLRAEFEDVKIVRWDRPDDGMPRSREEVLPLMEFFAARLRSGWS